MLNAHSIYYTANTLQDNLQTHYSTAPGNTLRRNRQIHYSTAPANSLCNSASALTLDRAPLLNYAETAYTHWQGPKINISWKGLKISVPAKPHSQTAHPPLFPRY